MVESWLSLDDIAAYLEVVKDAVPTWIAEEVMLARKVGCLWQFRVCEIDDWRR